jgi:hypothetical protein
LLVDGPVRISAFTGCKPFSSPEEFSKIVAASSGSLGYKLIGRYTLAEGAGNWSLQTPAQVLKRLPLHLFRTSFCAGSGGAFPGHTGLLATLSCPACFLHNHSNKRPKKGFSSLRILNDFLYICPRICPWPLAGGLDQTGQNAKKPITFLLSSVG